MLLVCLFYITNAIKSVTVCDRWQPSFIKGLLQRSINCCINSTWNKFRQCKMLNAWLVLYNMNILVINAWCVCYDGFGLTGLIPWRLSLSKDFDSHFSITRSHIFSRIFWESLSDNIHARCFLSPWNWAIICIFIRR